MRRPNRERNNFESSGATFFLSCPLPDRQMGSEPLLRGGTPGTDYSSPPDLNWLLTAYQRLSQELELDNLLVTLIEILLETAIVSKAWVILEKSDQWAIAASGSLESNSVQILQSLPLETAASPLLERIVNRVLHTQTPLVLNEVSQEVDLIPHSQFQPLSVFCLPLQFQGKLIAILYLENYFITDAFTREFRELLNRLSSQMAIAFKNADRYQNLKQKVSQHTQALAQAISELKHTQKKLVQSEKMVALGQLIAGIAHEINTPLGAIYASVQNLSHALDYTLEKFPPLLRKLSPTQQEDLIALLAATRLNNKPLSFREERQCKRTLENQLINQGFKQAETTAQMLVEMGITEVKTPILRLLQGSNSTEILDTAYHLVLQYRNSDNIQLAVDKASTVVAALKRYVHSDRCDCMTTAQIPEEIDTVLTLYQHQFKPGIQVTTNYQDLPEILCYPEQLNQVWANLIHNAIQAMGSQGKLEITATRRYHFIQVQITDSGCGIPAEIQDKIFEPFFTTKEAGVGTGLGLDIARQIVEQHQGHIEVKSQPGRTRFTVYLPIEKTPKSSMGISSI
ncbi:MAG: ATP-binding protein [Lyngbya sp.]|nr:ATP-binding protein [Lyngbya sp.]